MSDTQLILQQLQTDAKSLENHLINIESGLQLLLYIMVGFLAWQIIKVLYKLFGGIFFGGI